MTGSERMMHQLGVVELRQGFSDGRIDLREYVQAMMSYCTAIDPEVDAFAHYDLETISIQLDRLIEFKHLGDPLPALYGVPIGIKDNIDTEDYPTELGLDLAKGRTPSQDAFLVHRLRQAGALVWAKTRTTALATRQPTTTKNPAVPGHSPGGSSSGSAAAVACGMVPASIGTQTVGSVIRPAAFCGVFAYKPTRGLISNEGVLANAPSVDQVGVFARNVVDLAAVAEAMIASPSRASNLVFPRRLYEVCVKAPPLQPRLMFARTPFWDLMEDRAKVAYESLLLSACAFMTELDLPKQVKHVAKWHQDLVDAEQAYHQAEWIHQLDPSEFSLIHAMAERGNQIKASEYLACLARLRQAESSFDEYFDRFDAIVIPSALGPAPAGLESTGDPIMSTLGTFCGLPCMNLPLLQTEEGQPLGLQLIGAPRQDAKLLRTANWLCQALESL
ncbi:MAG: amidase [Burkholderiaceae bacterium]|jgi:Asp-tRNA(Asn)/Glu-tRNA(Gln) amidotransferase A subunit family amidase